MKLLLPLAVLLLLPGPPPPVPSPLSAESEAFRREKLTHMLLDEEGGSLRPAERLPAYTRYNFGPLWLDANQYAKGEVVRGFIGAHYQRLQVRLLTAQKSATDPALYTVTGKTRVLGVVRPFRGTVRLQQVREARRLRLPPPGEGFTTKVTARGTLVARYDLFEDSTQTKTGVFRGVLAAYWYTDGKRRLHYDAIEGYADGSTNNQYVGTWTRYGSRQPLRCNWGDSRVPNSGDLDMGAGYFSPADKYLPYGWQDVRDALGGNEAAQRREAQQWWR